LCPLGYNRGIKGDFYGILENLPQPLFRERGELSCLSQ
jgi:hypothetical protein